MEKTKLLQTRVDSKVFNLFKEITAQKGMSTSEYLRRLVNREIKNDAALSSQDQLTAAVRKAIRLELKTTENRLANLAAKSVITSATAERISYLILKNQNHPNASMVRDLARKKAVAYLRENLNEILETYEQVLEGD